METATGGLDVTDEKVAPPSTTEDHEGDGANAASTEPAPDQENREATPDAQEITQDTPENSGSSWIWGLVLWAGTGTWIALANRTSRIFLSHWWWVFVLAAAVVGILLIIRPVRGWLKCLTPNYRAALFIFGVIPLLLALIGSVTVLPQRYQIIALRSVILVTVCLLPAVMWFLFIATRKASLLNGFLTNLYRLGLLASSPKSSETVRAADPAYDQRLLSYLQKFESVYGALPAPVRKNVLKNGVSPYSKSEVTSPIALSTTTIPVMLSTVLIALGWLITLPPAQAPLTVTDASSWARAFEPTATPVTLAFLGAYFFSLQMLFRRYVRNDLGGSAYVAVSMRIILAVIGTWAVMVASLQLKLVNNEQLLVIGFVIGVFPRVAWQLIQAAFHKLTPVSLKSMESNLPLSDLDGLTVWHEARLEEEDIENIPNMATTDLVELLINTRFPAERIVDWVDQAILYTQLGADHKDTREQLRQHGIRTASSLLAAFATSRKQNDDLAADGSPSDNTVRLDPYLEAALLTNSNLTLVQRWLRTSPVKCDPAAGPTDLGGSLPDERVEVGVGTQGRAISHADAA
jgi:hypothetical protein